MTHDVGSCVYLTDAHRVRRLEYHLERQHRDPVDGPDDGGLVDCDNCLGRLRPPGPIGSLPTGFSSDRAPAAA